MSKEALLAALQPILTALPAIDVKDPKAAVAGLAARFPLSALQEVRRLVRQGVTERWLCDRENGGVRFSRLQKAAPGAEGPAGFSIDAVHMSGPAVGHTHPNGEIDLCFAVPGDGAHDAHGAHGAHGDGARFDGHPEGWVVYDPQSWHVPTVTGGAMDILYFLPGGAIRFEDKPASSSSP